MIFRHDNPARATLALLGELGLCSDPRYRGEIARLFDGRKPRAAGRYRTTGVTIDGFAEALYDRGIVAERPGERETFDWLETCLTPAPKTRGRRSGPTARGIEAEIERARTVRARRYECDRCGQILRGTRKTEVTCTRCLESTFATIASALIGVIGDARVAAAVMATVRECISPMRRTSPLPEELLETALELDGSGVGGKR